MPERFLATVALIVLVFSVLFLFHGLVYGLKPLRWSTEMPPVVLVDYTLRPEGEGVHYPRRMGLSVDRGRGRPLWTTPWRTVWEDWTLSLSFSAVQLASFGRHDLEIHPVGKSLPLARAEVYLGGITLGLLAFSLVRKSMRRRGALPRE